MATVRVNWTETITYEATIEVDLPAGYEFAGDHITAQMLEDATTDAVIHGSYTEIHSAD
jgi:hypothetical protein